MLCLFNSIPNLKWLMCQQNITGFYIYLYTYLYQRAFYFMLLSSIPLFQFEGLHYQSLVEINSFCFCLYGKVLISPSFLKDSFAGYSILGWHFQHLKYIILLPSCLQGFCWEFCWWSSRSSFVHNESLFSRFCLYLWLLTVWSLGVLVWLSGFTLLRVHWVSWICIPFPSPNLEFFSHNFFKSALYPFLLSSPSVTCIIYTFICLMVSSKSLKLSSFFFLFAPLTQISNDPSSSLPILFSAWSNLLLNPS